MLFQFAFLLPTYPSATAIIALIVVVFVIVVVVVRMRSCRPCQRTPPSRQRGKAAAVGSFQPFEDVKTQSLSIARESESKSTSHTRSLAGIINTPICLHSSSYKVSRMLSSVRRSARSRFFRASPDSPRGKKTAWEYAVHEQEAEVEEEEEEGREEEEVAEEKTGVWHAFVVRDVLLARHSLLLRCHLLPFYSSFSSSSSSPATSSSTSRATPSFFFGFLCGG